MFTIYPNTEGFISKPCITHDLLAKYHEGLICTSACIGGEIPQLLLKGDYAGALKAALWYNGLFGDDFYLEVSVHRNLGPVKLAPYDDRDAYRKQNHKLTALQNRANRGIFSIAASTGIKVVATNDVHFVLREDGIAHDAMLCLTHRKHVSDPQRLRYSHLEYLKSEEEMARLFPGHPEVLSNTMEIADEVNRYCIREETSLPHVSDDPDGDLRQAAEQGAVVRYGSVEGGVRERLDSELSVIREKGAAAYFLLLKDAVDWARGEGIAIGPGRGAAAGSAVAYCLGITGINPLEHGLLFERFYNRESRLMASIDLDVEPGTREKIIAHLKEIYGKYVAASQYDADGAANCGALRVNITELGVLSVIKKTVAEVKRRYGVDIDPHSLPLDNPETIDLFRSGDTAGVFQFESERLMDYLRQLHPETFSDLVAMNALYRPGPLDEIPSFILRKNGGEAVTYELPGLEPILAMTYGIVVYQEQLMLFAQRIGGFSPEESDMLRKAACKKKTGVLDELGERFVEIGVGRGMDRAALEKAWKEMTQKGLYAFNKSHALCYTYLAFVTAWLKAHYPKEFFEVSLNESIDKDWNLKALIPDCEAHGFEVLHPDRSGSGLFEVRDKED